jgi:hypothetical protein
MKRKSSELPRAEDSGYKILPRKEFPYYSLEEAAQELEIHPTRLSRLIRILQIPVHRPGTGKRCPIYVDKSGFSRAKKALTNREVSAGRKKIWDKRPIQSS